MEELQDLHFVIICSFRDRLDFLNRGDQLMREIKHFDGQKWLDNEFVRIFYEKLEH